jgi:DNA-binding XRE family transcriptional regulator
LRNNIRKFRNARSMSQRDLAKAVGTSQQQIQRIETSQQAVKIQMAARICKALGCEIHDLFPAAQKQTRKIQKILKSATPPSSDEALTLEKTTGLDSDPLNWKLTVILRGGASCEFPVSAGTIQRLRAASENHPTEFFCFDSQELQVALNLKHTLHFHARWDSPLVITPNQKYEPRNQIRVTLAGINDPLVFGVDPDDVERTDLEDNPGPLASIMRRLNEDPNYSDFIEFRDEDGEDAFFRVEDLAMLTICQNGDEDSES